MLELEQLHLTEKDFDLLVEGLEAIPSRGMAGEIMGALFEGMMTKDDPIAEAKLRADRERKTREREQREKMMKEEIQILKGKLLMFKRLLIEKSLLAQVNHSINPSGEETNDFHTK